ncbi:hypothetical protein Gotur_018669 [Gossypium turneri]
MRSTFVSSNDSTLPSHGHYWFINSNKRWGLGGGFLLTENGMLLEFQGLTFVSLHGKSFTFFGTEKLTEESEHTEEDTDFQFLQHWIKVCSF